MVKPVVPQDIVDSWPAKNLVNPEVRSHEAFLGITLAFTLVTLFIVSLRTYVRFFMLRAPGWDDYFIFIAVLADVALCILINLAFQNYGWDRHQWDQRDEWFQVSELMQWLIQITFIVLMTFSKLSALVTYLRASSRTKYNRFVWATMIVVALWGISFLFATIFECTPVHLYWTSVDGKGCSNEDARLLIATVVNIATDLIVVLMPIPLILKLHFPLREKVTLAILMSLGMLATIASVVRTVVMSQSLYTLRYDTTWNSFVVWIWLALECNLAISCISIPVLRVLLRRIVPSYWPSTHHSGSKAGPTQNLTSSSNMPRDVKHASFTSMEIKALKSEDGIEMFSRPTRNDSLRSYSEGDHTRPPTSVSGRGVHYSDGEHTRPPTSVSARGVHYSEGDHSRPPTSVGARGMHYHEGDHTRPPTARGMHYSEGDHTRPPTNASARGMHEAGEHFYQYHFRPAKGDSHTVARAV